MQQDALEAVVDMREFDVAYHMRFAIDTGVRCGHWFTVSAHVRPCLARSHVLACTLNPSACFILQLQPSKQNDGTHACCICGEAGLHLAQAESGVRA